MMQSWTSVEVSELQGQGCHVVSSSYTRGLHFGVTGNRDSDLAVPCRGIEDGLRELRDAADDS
jgi:hypothetical protein